MKSAYLSTPAPAVRPDFPGLYRTDKGLTILATSSDGAWMVGTVVIEGATPVHLLGDHHTQWHASSFTRCTPGTTVTLTDE